MAAQNNRWNGLAEMLGIVGVIGSLLFVAMEIRQNTNAVRSETIQGVLDQSVSVNLVPVESADLRAAIYGAPESLTDDQRRQVGWFYSAIVRVQLNRFSQAQVGILDQESVLELGGRGGVFQTPTFVSWWAGQGGRYSPEFEEFIDALVIGKQVDDSWMSTTSGVTENPIE